MKIVWFGIITSTLIVSLSAAEGFVEYWVKLPAPQTQTLEIEARFHGLEGKKLELMMPVWRPGKYEVLDPAGTLYGLRVHNGKGEPLEFEKTAKSTWSIALSGAQEAQVSYTLYANSIADRTRHVDDSHAFLSGSSVFLYSPERRDWPVRVHVEAPASWSVATGLSAISKDGRLLAASNYDVLVDSPLEIGEHTKHLFHSHDRPHEIVVWGEADYDAEELVEDFRAIVDNQIALWGSPPYERYVFLLHLGPGLRGGTEHLNSTIMQASRESLEDKTKYQDFLGLVSHEFFHTWNVKQIRPVGLSPYNYQEENYTSLLWLVEGTTSYYDDLCLMRSGRISPKAYLKRLSKLIDSYRKTPGRQIQSVAESSFDAWIKFNHPTPHSRNTTVSFYSKGALVSLLMDLFVRENSEGSASLDDLLRKLYRDYPYGSAGYSEENLRRHISILAGKDSNSFFDDYIQGTAPLGLEAALGAIGIELRLKADNKDSENSVTDDSALGAYLGVSLRGTTVSSVASDGPAFQKGLIVGDEIMALDGRRLESGKLAKRLEGYASGEKITLSFFRGDRLRSLELVLGGRPKGQWTVSFADDVTADQKKAFESWSGQLWPGNDEETK